VNHPIEKYWQVAFENFQYSKGCYFVPELEDPILSPRFNQTSGPHLNLITSHDHEIKEIPGYQLRNNFFLGSFKTKKIKFDKSAIKIKHLKEAINDDHFWDLLKDGFNKDYYFLKKLMGFLLTLKAQYRVAYLIENETPYACVVLGITGDEAVLLSGVIKSSHRGKKMSRKLESLTHYVALNEGVQECFFWTLSEKLLNYADNVNRYLIYIKDKEIL